MIQETATHSVGRRVVRYFWDGPVIESETDPGWNDRIELEIRHDEAHKRYRAMIYKIQARKEQTYTMTRFTIFETPSALVMTAPIARFSERSFSVFAAEVIDACESLLSSGTETIAGSLLSEAVNYSVRL